MVAKMQTSVLSYLVSAATAAAGDGGAGEYAEEKGETGVVKSPISRSLRELSAACCHKKTLNNLCPLEVKVSFRSWKGRRTAAVDKKGKDLVVRQSMQRVDS